MLSTHFHLMLTKGSEPPSVTTVQSTDGMHVTASYSPNVDTAAISWFSLHDALNHALHLISEAAPDLDHVGLVDLRHSLDALGTKVTNLIALLEQENTYELRAIEADEVRA